MNDLEITPLEVKKRIDRGDKILIVDVREHWEYAHCRIESALHIPMGSIPANLQKLDTDDDVICYCHHGCAASTWPIGCDPRESLRPNPWPEALNGGLPKLILESRVIDGF